MKHLEEKMKIVETEGDVGKSNSSGNTTAESGSVGNPQPIISPRQVQLDQLQLLRKQQKQQKKHIRKLSQANEKDILIGAILNDEVDTTDLRRVSSAPFSLAIAPTIETLIPSMVQNNNLSSLPNNEVTANDLDGNTQPNIKTESFGISAIQTSLVIENDEKLSNLSDKIADTSQMSPTSQQNMLYISQTLLLQNDDQQLDFQDVHLKSKTEEEIIDDKKTNQIGVIELINTAIENNHFETPDLQQHSSYEVVEVQTNQMIITKISHQLLPKIHAKVFQDILNALPLLFLFNSL
jgi:hypothetical protein